MRQISCRPIKPQAFAQTEYGLLAGRVQGFFFLRKAAVRKVNGKQRNGGEHGKYRDQKDAQAQAA